MKNLLFGLLAGISSTSLAVEPRNPDVKPIISGTSPDSDIHCQVEAPGTWQGGVGPLEQSLYQFTRDGRLQFAISNTANGNNAVGFGSWQNCRAQYVAILHGSTHYAVVDFTFSVDNDAMVVDDVVQFFDTYGTLLGKSPNHVVLRRVTR
ncbi:hypothetical protein [Candidatus Methylocalor cossyra]|uniref:Secreted protein n=1 Tax=Candidatus Methylocalor cossyra TaxID=3108543 RepID=A0ABM9NJW3_9GAMM